MEIEKSNIVQAVAGRERGRYFFVLAETGDFLLLADGKCRRIETPKKKKKKHVRLIAESDARVAQKIRNEEKITNSELRKALAVFGEDGNQDREG